MPDPQMVTFTLNGQMVQAPAGVMLVDAAKAAGVEIPIFCYEPRLGAPIGACRMCLVEIEGMRGLQTACSTPVAADMVVKSESPVAKDAQDGVLELLLANHPLDCPVCDKGGECPLQDRTFRFGPGRTRTIEPKLHLPKPLEISPRVALDRERCIACFRCVRFSQDISQDGGLVFQERGDHTEIATFDGEPWRGRFTGNTIDLCPVGALTSIPYRFVSRPWDITVTPSVCAGCAMGCNIDVTARDGEIKRVTGRAEANMAVEEGWICDRGRWGYAALRSGDRVRAAQITDAVGRREVPLERAVSHAAALLSRGRVGILLDDTVTLEAAYLARCIAHKRGWPAPAHRGPAWPAAMSGVGMAVGMDALDVADAIVVVGGDLCAQQPVAELRLRAALRRGARVVMVAPQLSALPAEWHLVAPDLGGAAETVASVLAEERRVVVMWDVAAHAAAPDAARALAAVINPECGVIPLAPGANALGLQLLGARSEARLRADLVPGECDTVLVVGDHPTDPAWDAACADAVRIDVATWRPAQPSDVLLGRLDPLEEEGTMLSMAARVQRLRPAARECPDAAAAWELLLALAVRLGVDVPERTPAAIFARMARETPALAGLDYQKLGVAGVALHGVTWNCPDDDVPGEDMPVVVIRPVFGDAVARRSGALDAEREHERCTLHPDDARRRDLMGASRVHIDALGRSFDLCVDSAVHPGAIYLQLAEQAWCAASSLSREDA